MALHPTGAHLTPTQPSQLPDPLSSFLQRADSQERQKDVCWSRSCSLTLTVCQGSLGEGRLGEGRGLRELLQDLFQVLGNFSKRGSGAGFHLIDGNRVEDVSFLSPSLGLRRQLMGRAAEGQEAYAAAVDGQKQERQRAVISHQGSKRRHIQAKVL